MHLFNSALLMRRYFSSYAIYKLTANFWCQFSQQEYILDTDIRNSIASSFVMGLFYFPGLDEIIGHQAYYADLCVCLLVFRLHTFISFTTVFNSMMRKQHSFPFFCSGLPSPWHLRVWVGVSSKGASLYLKNLPPPHSGCWFQYLSWSLFLCRGLLSPPGIHWSPNNNVCTHLSHNVDKIRILDFWVTCKSEERA